MQTMNISLPGRMKQYVEEQVNVGGYSSASDYVRELVRADQKRRDKERLEQLLLQSLQSGEPIKIIRSCWTTCVKDSAPAPRPVNHPSLNWGCSGYAPSPGAK